MAPKLPASVMISSPARGDRKAKRRGHGRAIITIDMYRMKGQIPKSTGRTVC